MSIDWTCFICVHSGRIDTRVQSQRRARPVASSRATLCTARALQSRTLHGTARGGQVFKGSLGLAPTTIRPCCKLPPGALPAAPVKPSFSGMGIAIHRVTSTCQILRFSKIYLKYRGGPSYNLDCTQNYYLNLSDLNSSCPGTAVPIPRCTKYYNKNQYKLVQIA